MEVTLVTEARFVRAPDMTIWSEAADCHFFQRYLDVFDSVRVLARVADAERVPSQFRRACGSRIRFQPLPHYLGPMGYLRQARKIALLVGAVEANAEAVLLRVPGQVANSIFHFLRKRGHPFGVEVVGDPGDVLAPGAVEHPFRRLIRWWWVRQMTRQCREALGAAYVTQSTLQGRYPNAHWTTSYSSIDLGPEAFAPGLRKCCAHDGSFRLVFVGSLAQLYKGPDLLIEAVARCQRAGTELRLDILGDGKFRPLLEDQVNKAALAETVVFHGHLPAGAAVRQLVSQADLFVLPSRTEGLPRAMIEAMALGVPCIGSAVGGIPELLPETDLVPPGDAAALAQKIGEVLHDPDRLARMSSCNRNKAEEFRKEHLELRRRNFYLHLRNQTETWLRAGRARS